MSLHYKGWPVSIHHEHGCHLFVVTHPKSGGTGAAYVRIARPAPRMSGTSKAWTEVREPRIQYNTFRAVHSFTMKSGMDVRSLDYVRRELEHAVATMSEPLPTPRAGSG